MRILYLLFLSLNLGLYGCNMNEMNIKVDQPALKLRGILVDADDENIVMPEVVITLYEQYQPLYAPKSWRQIDQTKTDSEGLFYFDIKVNGPFQIRWYPKGKKGLKIKNVPAFEGEKFLKVEHSDNVKMPW